MTIGFIPDMRRAHQVDLFLNPFFEDLMRLHYCDEHGTFPPDLSLYEAVMKEYNEFKGMKLLEDHFKPLLNGGQIIEITGLKPGPKIKTLLIKLRQAQIEEGISTKEKAIEFIKKSA